MDTRWAKTTRNTTAPRRDFIEDHDSGQQTIRVWCRWRCHWHEHGYSGIPIGDTADRASHCYAPDSPYKDTGYEILISGTPFSGRMTARTEPGERGRGRGDAVRVPFGASARKHVERIRVSGGGDGDDQEERELRLGAWIGNQRGRATTRSPERVEQLSAIEMRWS
ncbi:helicase associated domain-containing protein [Streptomyces sp. NPDC020192]|uniref:helicase associated domain-containing protein n=1 Tax=Streptomyces sp. NPDC020192 TaxID=3365066 RepID=UPI00379822DF